MLHFKRKLDQAIRVAGNILITVKAITDAEAELLIERTDSSYRLKLRHGDTVKVPVERLGELSLELTKINRGEALLSLQAPRSITIDREESRRSETSL